MATPIREIIVAQYVIELKKIKTDNGYEIDLNDRVLRQIRHMPHEVPTVCVITEGETAETGRPVRHITQRLTVNCFLILRHGNDLATLDTAINKGVADVKKAIQSAASLRGGHVTGSLNAVNRTWFVRDNPSILDDESALEYTVQQIVFETEYVSKHDDPYTGRGQG